MQCIACAEIMCVKSIFFSIKANDPLPIRVTAARGKEANMCVCGVQH